MNKKDVFNTQKSGRVFIDWTKSLECKHPNLYNFLIGAIVTFIAIVGILIMMLFGALLFSISRMLFLLVAIPVIMGVIFMLISL